MKPLFEKCCHFAATLGRYGGQKEATQGKRYRGNGVKKYIKKWRFGLCLKGFWDGGR